MTDRVSALLGCAHPVVLAGMGGPSRSELVAAVTRAGGFGFLGMVREPPALIAQEAGKLRRSGCHRFGVNIIPAATAPDLLESQIETIIALGVPVVGLFWDIDVAVVARLREAGIVVVYQVGAADEAVAAERAGAHIVIAQGREAGGHVRGVTPLRELVPAVCAAVTVPVLAAGGLATGGDLLTAWALGAEGAVFGTVLLATEESFAHPYHKQRLVGAGPGDTLLTDAFHINWPPGAPVRVLSSAVTRGAHGREKAGTRIAIGAEGDRPIYLFSTDSPLRSMAGDFESMALYAGTGVGSITAIRSAADVVREIIAVGESSSACRAGEMGEACVKQPERAEIAAGIADVLSGLKALLAIILAEAAPRDSEGPPFAREGEAVARWIVRLAPAAADAAVPPVAFADAEQTRQAILDRLGLFVPRLSDGALATELSALRGWLEART